uniref:Uncharacterized protein n=1 Tax=Aureoumbra lagunensis TaxID=44058 RepID=A0A7S3JRE9_9STRA
MSLRDEIAADCLQWWVNKQIKGGRLRFASEKKVVPKINENGISTLQWSGSQVVWYGSAKSSRMRFSSLNLETFDIHRRAIIKTDGSFVATARMTAHDLESSAWVRFLLTKLLKAVLDEIDQSPIQRQLAAFSTKIIQHGRIRLDATADDGLRFAVSFRLDIESENIVLRSPELELTPGIYSPRLTGGVALPAPMIESFAALYLSTIAVDLSRSACRLSKLGYNNYALEATLVSNTVSAAKHEQDRLYFLRRRKAIPRNQYKTKFQQNTTLGMNAATALAIAKSSFSTPKNYRRPIITEWRVDKTTLAAMLTGNAMHPLRHSYVVGDEWPWVLNPRNRPKKRVTVAFCILSAALNILAAADACNLAFRATAHRLWLSIVKSPVHWIVKHGKRCWRIATIPFRLISRAGSSAIAQLTKSRTHKFYLHRRRPQTTQNLPTSLFLEKRNHQSPYITNQQQGGRTSTTNT